LLGLGLGFLVGSSQAYPTTFTPSSPTKVVTVYTTVERRVTETLGARRSLQCLGSSLCFWGRVTRIVDGETPDVEGGRVWLVLVNTPERGQGGCEEARRFTAKTCPVGSSVVVERRTAHLD